MIRLLGRYLDMTGNQKIAVIEEVLTANLE
jgi:hypothetical protein